LQQLGIELPVVTALRPAMHDQVLCEQVLGAVVLPMNDKEPGPSEGLAHGFRKASKRVGFDHHVLLVPLRFRRTTVGRNMGGPAQPFSGNAGKGAKRLSVGLLDDAQQRTQSIIRSAAVKKGVAAVGTPLHQMLSVGLFSSQNPTLHKAKAVSMSKRQALEGPFAGGYPVFQKRGDQMVAPFRLPEVSPCRMN